jgi:DNA repair protein RadC
MTASRRISSLSIRSLPVNERPRERLCRLGAEALSEQELLACLLGRGIAGESVLVSAQRLLAAFGSVRGIADASIEALTAVHGIGASKAVQLKAAVALAKRTLPEPYASRAFIDSDSAAAAVVRPHLAELKKEQFMALLLDTRRRLIRLSTIAVGSLAATVVHPRELFKEAIAASASAVIVAHNHPSGDPEPSSQDIALTQRLVEAGALLGIEVLDHLIIGSGEFVSLRAGGWLSPSPPHTQRRSRP